jgi:arylformamidase
MHEIAMPASPSSPATPDPDWLDAQYNNRLRVPGHAAVLDRWAQASALARTQDGTLLDLRYGDGPGETLDLFPPMASAPPSAGGAPVLVAIHGGYWRALSKSDFSLVAPSFTAEGALVVVPEYALAPAVTVEHITLQLARALAWVWRNAARFGGDPSRIVVAGHSAGGHAATMLLCCRWKQLAEDLPERLVSRALSISGLYDLEPLRHTRFLQPDLKLTRAAVARLSPAFFPRPKGQLNVVVGADESEEFIRQNRLIRDVWGPTSVPVCETLPGTDHFTVLHSLADPQGRAHDLARRLLGLA